MFPHLRHLWLDELISDIFFLMSSSLSRQAMWVEVIQEVSWRKCDRTGRKEAEWEAGRNGEQDNGPEKGDMGSWRVVREEVWVIRWKGEPAHLIWGKQSTLCLCRSVS